MQLASAFSFSSAVFDDDSDDANVSKDDGGPGGAGEAVFDDSEDEAEELPVDEATEDDCTDKEDSLVSVSELLLGVGIRGTFFTSRIFLTSKTPFSAAAAAFSAALVATACCSMLALWAGSSL